MWRRPATGETLVPFGTVFWYVSLQCIVQGLLQNDEGILINSPSAGTAHLWHVITTTIIQFMENLMEFYSQWCYPVQPFGPFTEVVNNAGNTCMSLAPATVFPALQEARKWVNQSKRQRVHRIWNQIQLLPIIGFQLMTVNDLGWAWNFPISGLHQYPVANWSVSSWAVGWWCARIHFQLLVFAATSWPIFPRMLVSARTCNSKADSEEAISWLYIRFRMYCKQNCRDVQHACLRSARNGASMMTTQAC